jgi:O-antigen/teichoic acid export membrane protein
MTSTTEARKTTGYAKSIILRFAHLLSAQGVDGILSTVFFLYLAWLNKDFFGEVMLAQAAGAILVQVVSFGLYYPQVADLTRADEQEKAEIINNVNAIKVALLLASMLVLWVVTGFRGYSPRMAWIVLVIALGNAVEAVADSFFADMRVRGLQRIEARIKIGGAVAAYGYGLVTAFTGMPLFLVALYKLVSGVIRVVLGLGWHIKTYSFPLSILPEKWSAIYTMFSRAAIFALIQILGTVYNKVNFFFLERASGPDGVALYSATYNLVDPISTMASEQLLGWVVFPVLSVMWWKKREEVAPLVKNTALWLIVIASPIMFLFYAESKLLMGLIYPAGYAQAAGLQEYLVWSIPLSFQSNLFQYVMMVAGAPRMLLLFQAMTTILSLVYNLLLVQRLGPLGGCLVLVFTKLTMTIFAFMYCQLRFRYFHVKDFLFPCALAAGGFALFEAAKPVCGLHLAVILTLVVYLAVLWRLGMYFLGDFPRKGGDVRGGARL